MPVLRLGMFVSEYHQWVKMVKKGQFTPTASIARELGKEKKRIPDWGVLIFSAQRSMIMDSRGNHAPSVKQSIIEMTRRD